jgi:predicted MFS family arabinose efflux permease
MSVSQLRGAAAGAPAEPGAAEVARHARGNIARLAIAQAISMFVVGTALATLPAGMLAHRFGRRVVLGSACGVLVGLLGCVAVLIGSFWLFCTATLFGGAYMAVIATFCFAAADGAPPESRARALSLVMAGGLFAGIIGPQLVTLTMDAWVPYLFAATYLAQAGVAVLAGIVLWGVRLPRIRPGDGPAGRPLPEILRQPRLLGAVAAGVVSYFIMNTMAGIVPTAQRA